MSRAVAFIVFVCYALPNSGYKVPFVFLSRLSSFPSPFSSPFPLLTGWYRSINLLSKSHVVY